MRMTLQSWMPTGREIMAGVISSAVVAVPGFALAAIATWFADPDLTRFGKVLVALAIAFAVAVIWLLFAAGWRMMFPAPKRDDGSRKLAPTIAETLGPIAELPPLKIATQPTSVAPPKQREWTAYEKGERARQIGDVLKFLDGDVGLVLAEAQRLVGGHRLPLRNRPRAAAYIGDLAANRDASREILKTLQRMASSCYADIATLFDEHEFSKLISAEDNYIRSLGNALQLPADTKLEILSDLLSPRVGDFEVAVDELRRWHGAAKHNLIALREAGG